MFRWCERHDVHCCVGIAKNSRLLEAVKSATEIAEEEFNKTQEKQRLFSGVCYAAESWDQSRRSIVKAEHSELGANPRFVVPNLDDSPGFVYDTIYCARGEMENRIKEQQLGLLSDRTSCHKWWSNQFRLLLSSLAYILIEDIRRLTLKNTELAKAQASTIRLKLLEDQSYSNAQYSAYPICSRIGVSVPGYLLASREAAQHGLNVPKCGPRHLPKTRGTAEVYLKSGFYPAVRSFSTEKSSAPQGGIGEEAHTSTRGHATNPQRALPQRNQCFFPLCYTLYCVVSSSSIGVSCGLRNWFSMKDPTVLPQCPRQYAEPASTCHPSLANPLLLLKL